VRHDIGRDNCFFLHVSLVPYIGPSGELKTKPTQHSVAALRSIGIQPDAVVCRADRELPSSIKKKISLMCDVDEEAVVTAADAPSIYDIPKVLHREGLDAYVVRRLNLPFRDVDWTLWDDLLRKVHHPSEDVTIALVGKYVDLPDAYLSVVEALRAGGLRPRREGQRRVGRVPTTARPPDGAAKRLADVDAVCVPGGFGIRGIEGKLGALTYARTHGIPTLGLCLGLQCMVIEFARSVAGPGEGGLHRVRPRLPRARDRHHGRADAYVEGAGDLGGTMRSVSTRPTCSTGSVVGGLRRRPDRRSDTGTATRCNNATARRCRLPGSCSRACRRTATWSSTSSSPSTCTRTTSPPRPTPSSAPARPARTRCSRAWSARRSTGSAS
jgi:CTP synthase